MIVQVYTDLVFDEFDPFDPLLHVCRGDIGLRHFECEGGEVDVDPKPYKRGVLTGWRRVDGPASTDTTLRCLRCGVASVPYPLDRISRALRLYLVGPAPEDAPAQAIGANDRFAPPDWPPRRRHSTDRRDEHGRHRADRTMEGRRRLGQDRRANPLDADDPRPGARDDVAPEEGED